MIIRKLFDKTKKIFVHVILTVSLSQTVLAHDLEQTSAQIIMRDGQVEIRLYVDVEHWLEKLQDPTAWLTGESDFLLLQSEVDLLEEYPTYILGLGNYLVQKIILLIDNDLLVLTPVNQTRYSDQSALMEFRLSAQHSNSNPKNIDIQFPVSLGEVHVSVVQPQYGFAPAGELQTFKIE